MKPCIVAIVGNAGSGKDTAAEFALSVVRGQSVAFADPMKNFCKKVFQFTDKQLWGPSEFRNGPDPRFSTAKPIGTIQKIQNFFQQKTPPTAHDVYWNRINAKIALLEHKESFINEVVPPHTNRNLAHIALLDWMDEEMSPVNLEISPRSLLQSIGTRWGRDTIGKNIWVDAGIRKAQEIASGGSHAIIRDCRFLNEARRVKEAGGAIWRIVRPIKTTHELFKHASEKEQFSPEMDTLVDNNIINNGSLEDLKQKVKQAILGTP